MSFLFDVMLPRMNTISRTWIDNSYSLKGDGDIHRCPADHSLVHCSAGAALRIALHAAAPHQRRVVLMHLPTPSKRDVTS
jgi:hypothetical protein